METEFFEGLNYGDEDKLLSSCEYHMRRMIKTARLVAKGVGLPKNQWIWNTYKAGVEVTFFVDPKLTDEPENVCLWIEFNGDMVVGLWGEGERGDSAQKFSAHEDWKTVVAKVKALLERGRAEKRKEMDSETEEPPPVKSPKIQLMFKLADQVGQGMLLKDSAWSCKPHEKGLELKFYHDPDYPQDGDNIVGVWVNFEGQMAVDFWPRGHGDKWSYSDWEEVVTKAKRLLLKIKHRKRREAEGIEEDSGSA